MSTPCTEDAASPLGMDPAGAQDRGQSCAYNSHSFKHQPTGQSMGGGAEGMPLWCPFPTALPQLCPQHPTHSPPAVQSWNGSNWVQILALLFTTKFLNLWTKSFFTFKLGVKLLGPHIVGPWAEPACSACIQQVLTDGRLPCLVPSTWFQQLDLAPVFPGGGIL